MPNVHQTVTIAQIRIPSELIISVYLEMFIAHLAHLKNLNLERSCRKHFFEGI